jgi:hypothetical protein
MQSDASPLPFLEFIIKAPTAAVEPAAQSAHFPYDALLGMWPDEKATNRCRSPCKTIASASYAGQVSDQRCTELQRLLHLTRNPTARHTCGACVGRGPLPTPQDGDREGQPRSRTCCGAPISPLDRVLVKSVSCK